MNVSCMSFDVDDNFNLVARPGVFASHGFNVVDNEKDTLFETFRQKAKKILPDVKVEDLTDEFAREDRGAIRFERDIIGLLYRNDDTKWYFEKQEQQQFKDAIMLFTYYGCWATFHWDSSEKHVRAALGAWKRELYLNAVKKGINVKRFDDATDDNLGNAMSKLKDEEFLMLFKNKKLDAFYERHKKIDPKLWPCLLLDAKGRLMTFDLSVTKDSVLGRISVGDCLVCGEIKARNRCRGCHEEFMCDPCRKLVFDDFWKGQNHHCISCSLPQPIYIKQLRSFALHKPDEITDKLRDLYGPIVPLVK